MANNTNIGKTMNDLAQALSVALPDGWAIDEDNEGQIVVYTELSCDKNGVLRQFDPDADLE